MASAHNIPDRFAQSFSSWRNVLDAVPNDEPEARLKVFGNAAHEIAGFVASGGLDRIAAADELTEIAISFALDTELTQGIIAHAFETTIRPGNGHARRGAQMVVIVSNAAFAGTFKKLNYLVEGILQRGFIYALTGATGHAKSAIALVLAELVASPDRNAIFGKHKVEKGRVLYFAGENPIDICMRVIGSGSLREGYAPEQDQIFWICGRIEIKECFDDIRQQVAQNIGDLDLVIVDTSAAYFLGDEELSNTQMANHARMLRKLTELPGNPCVLVLCHPIKHAQDATQLLPRGGGAFLAEMDGNLTAWKQDELITLHYTKMRGPGFEEITLKLEPIYTPKLTDTKDRMIPTVRAVVVSESEEDRQNERHRDDENRVLLQMLFGPEQSFADIGRKLGWTNGSGEALKARVQRAVYRLEEGSPKLVKKNRGRWELTEKGKEYAAQIERNYREIAPEPIQQKML